MKAMILAVGKPLLSSPPTPLSKRGGAQALPLGKLVRSPPIPLSERGGD